MFKSVFSFKGRIRRTEFGISYIIYIVANIIIQNIVKSKEMEYIALTGLLYIPLIWFLMAQGTKRCHDRENSGWYQIIPFYGFWMLFADSDEGENYYGPNPKGFGNKDEIDEIGVNEE